MQSSTPGKHRHGSVGLPACPELAARQEIVDALANVELPSCRGDAVCLGALRASGPTALVHLLHFGCILCDRVADNRAGGAPACAPGVFFRGALAWPRV